MLLRLGVALIAIGGVSEPGLWWLFDESTVPARQSMATFPDKQIAENKRAGDEGKHDNADRPHNPQAMFLALGVDPSYFDRLADGTEISPTENETLLRVLYRLRRFPPVDLERWSGDVADLLEAKEPAPRRGEIFRLRGRVVEVQPIAVAATDAERFELPLYFRCRMKLEEKDRLAEIDAEQVPPAWRQGAEPDAPGGALGVFLKLGKKLDGRTLPIFASDRLAWYPETPLGRLGMDVGLLEAAAGESSTSLDTPLAREAFYQMLAAVGRAQPGALWRQARRDVSKVEAARRWTNRQGRMLFSVAPLFNDPQSQVGQLVALEGVARRIEEIRLGPDDRDIVARFGFDRYWQVALFTEDSQGNPLTVCVRQLPEGMPYGDRPHYAEEVRTAGFFFKTWSYAARAAVAQQSSKRQLSPLLIGNTLQWIPAEKR